MNKLTSLLIFASLTLPVSTLAQPDEGPRERPDRAEQRERGDRGDRHADRERSRPSKRGPLSVEQVEEALATLREMHGESNPAWLERIEKQVKENPEEAAKDLARFPRIREMMEARKHRPEEFALQSKQGQLMREVFHMVRDLRKAQADQDQGKIDQLKPKIRERIEQLFEIRMAMKEYEIKRMRNKLAKAEKDLAEIKADSKSLIDEKMNDIMSGKDPRGPRGEGKHPDRDRGERPKRERPDGQ